MTAAAITPSDDDRARRPRRPRRAPRPWKPDASAAEERAMVRERIDGLWEGQEDIREDLGDLKEDIAELVRLHRQRSWIARLLGQALGDKGKNVPVLAAAAVIVVIVLWGAGAALSGFGFTFSTAGASSSGLLDAASPPEPTP